jgi:hypothetical protein
MPRLFFDRRAVCFVSVDMKSYLAVSRFFGCFKDVVFVGRAKTLPAGLLKT